LPTRRVSIVFAALGNYLDAARYKHLDETDALNRAAVALITGSGRVITEQTFLDSIAGALSAFEPPAECKRHRRARPRAPSRAPPAPSPMPNIAQANRPIV
jgi:hypothetical protein